MATKAATMQCTCQVACTGVLFLRTSPPPSSPHLLLYKIQLQSSRSSLLLLLLLLLPARHLETSLTVGKNLTSMASLFIAKGAVCCFFRSLKLPPLTSPPSGRRATRLFTTSSSISSDHADYDGVEGKVEAERAKEKAGEASERAKVTARQGAGKAKEKAVAPKDWTAEAAESAEEKTREVVGRAEEKSEEVKDRMAETASEAVENVGK